jgi:hypothetical protein
MLASEPLYVNRKRGTAMRKKLLALLMVTLIFAACGGTAPMPTATVTSILPADKYVLIERWIEIYQGGFAFIDFPTYVFDPDTGELRPDIVPRGKWFPLDDLTELKVVYGRGTSRTGSAGSGINSRVFAVTELPFTEPAKEDTDVVVTVEGIDAQGVAYLKRGNQRIVLQPGQDWTREGKSTVEWGGDKLEIFSRERISNYGIQEKSKIQLVK